MAAAANHSGQGLRLPDNPLVITSSTLPPTLSGEYVDFEIPLSGGCDVNNPVYVVEVTSIVEMNRSGEVAAIIGVDQLAQ